MKELYKVLTALKNRKAEIPRESIKNEKKWEQSESYIAGLNDAITVVMDLIDEEVENNENTNKTERNG